MLGLVGWSRGVAHQAALNGWLHVPRLLFLHFYAPVAFVRSLLLLPTPSAQYCLMGMVGRDAKRGMREVACCVKFAIGISLLLNL